MALCRLTQRLQVKELLVKPNLSAVAVRTIVTKDFLEIPPDTPPPWPYKTKYYRWYHSFFNLDKTRWRINQNSKVILVEGNIGVGKSTFAKDLADQLGMKLFPEANFSDYYEEILKFDPRNHKAELPYTAQHFEIKEFYEDPNSWHTGSMQVRKYIARYICYIEALNHLLSTGQGVIMERSPYSDFVFMDAMAKKGYVGKNARRFYYDLKGYSIQELMRPHCVIYLDAPVDTCMERIKKRNIDYEIKSEAMTKDYLQLIEDGYKQHYLPQMEPCSEMLIYDWSKIADAEQVAEDLEKIDFDKERVYFDPKFRDWRELYLDSDWDARRIKFRDWQEDFGLYDEYIDDFLPLHGAPELFIPAEDSFIMNAVRNKYIYETTNKYYIQPVDRWSWKSLKLFWAR